MLRTVLLLGLALGLAAPAAAQHRRMPLQAGDQIRFSRPDSGAVPYVGRVVAWDSATISFAMAGDERRILQLNPRSYGEVQLRHRSREGGARSGALWGLFLGGSAGLIAGPFASDGTGMSFEASLAALSAGGGTAGALLGAAIGAAWAPARWRSYVFVR